MPGFKGQTTLCAQTFFDGVCNCARVMLPHELIQRHDPQTGQGICLLFPCRILKYKILQRQFIYVSLQNYNEILRILLILKIVTHAQCASSLSCETVCGRAQKFLFSSPSCCEATPDSYPKQEKDYTLLRAKKLCRMINMKTARERYKDYICTYKRVLHRETRPK